MDQVEKLFSALSPGAITVILEQVREYRGDLTGDQPGDAPEIAWCDRVREIGAQAIAGKK